MCQRLHTYSYSSLSFLSLNISHLQIKTTHMAKRNLDFLCSNQIKYRQPHSLILLFVFVSTVNSVLSQTPVTDCILQLSSPLNNSNCEASNWGGLINNCCSVVFDDYLDALGRWANQTGQIFLNSTEQNKCLNSMKIRDPSISDCGIEKLTSGAGGCSDYAVKLGNRLKSFGEGCKLLNSDGTSSQACSDCLRGWEEIVAASDSGIDKA